MDGANHFVAETRIRRSNSYIVNATLGDRLDENIVLGKRKQ